MMLNNSLKKRTKIFKIIVTVILFSGALASIFPFIWMLSTSFKFEIDVLEFPIRIIPKRVNYLNYVKVFVNSDFPLYYFNSLKVTSLSVMGNLVFTSLAAYSFARLKFKGRDAIFIFYLATMMIPIQVTLLPKYILFSYMGLINSHLALLLPAIFSVFDVFLMRQYFITIPFELTESAHIDGAGQLRIFYQIILPLAKPGLITVILLSFTWNWNDYLNPLIFLSSQDMLTLTVGLQRFQESFSSNYALIMAGATVALVPVIILFLAAQKYFIESFASAGIKG